MSGWMPVRMTRAPSKRDRARRRHERRRHVLVHLGHAGHVEDHPRRAVLGHAAEQRLDHVIARVYCR